MLHVAPSLRRLFQFGPQPHVSGAGSRGQEPRARFQNPGSCPNPLWRWQALVPRRSKFCADSRRVNDCRPALAPSSASSYSPAEAVHQSELPPPVGGAHDKPPKLRAAAKRSNHWNSPNTTPEGARVRTTPAVLVGSRRSPVHVRFAWTASQCQSACGRCLLPWLSAWRVFPCLERRLEHRGYHRPSRRAMLAGRDSARVRREYLIPPVSR